MRLGRKQILIGRMLARVAWGRLAEMLTVSVVKMPLTICKETRVGMMAVAVAAYLDLRRQVIWSGSHCLEP